VKVRPSGPKPIFRLKFDYNGRRYVLEKSTYQEIATILKRPKLADLVTSTKEMLTNIKNLPLKSTPKYQSKSDIKSKQALQGIEKSLQKKLKEQLERKIQEKRFTLQMLSQTLSRLSSNF
jgi:hypothetical protein